MRQQTVTFSPVWGKFLMLGLAGSLLASCGDSGTTKKKTSKKAPDTFLTDQKVENGAATFKYGSDDTNATFKCRTLINGQATTDWTVCPSGAMTVALPANAKMTFEVKAIGADGTEDSTPYSVEVGGSTGTGTTASFIQGAEKLKGQILSGAAKYQTFNFVANQTGAMQYKAYMDGQEVAYMVQGSMINFNVMQAQMTPGSHALRIDAIANGQVVAQETLNFCIDQCSTQGGNGGGMGNGAGNPGFTSPMVGPYSVNIPAGMHVNEYASNYSMYGTQDFYALMYGQDPNYIPVVGNYSCWGTVEMVGSFNYCHMTPQQAQFKGMNDFRMAYNHIEIATDPNGGAQAQSGQYANVSPYENIMINVFNPQYEFMNANSRFVNLCNRRPVGQPGIQPTRPVENVPILPGFFLGTLPQPVTMWVCETMTQGAYGQGQIVKVAGFFVNAPGFTPGCATTYNSAIELVYTSVPMGSDTIDAMFVRRAQERILNMLTRNPL